MNTVAISSNALLGNSANNFFEPFFWCKTFINIWFFDHLFLKSNISAIDRLVVMKFHTNIANRWLFIIQRKIMVIILYSWSYFDMFRGAAFFRTQCSMPYAIKHPLPDRVKPSFVIFGIRALWRSVWHTMLYSCTHIATVGVKDGKMTLIRENDYPGNDCLTLLLSSLAYIFYLDAWLCIFMSLCNVSSYALLST